MGSSMTTDLSFCSVRINNTHHKLLYTPHCLPKPHKDVLSGAETLYSFLQHVLEPREVMIIWLPD